MPCIGRHAAGADNNKQITWTLKSMECLQVYVTRCVQETHSVTIWLKRELPIYINLSFPSCLPFKCGLNESQREGS